MPMQTRKGQSLLELAVAIAVFVIGLTTVTVLYLQSLNIHRRSLERTQASQFALEGLEAVRAIRDNTFADLATGTQGLAIQGGRWVFSGTSDSFGGLTRQISLMSLDADTHVVTSTVTWLDGTQLHSLSYSTILTDWHKPPPSWETPAIVSTTTLFGGVAASAVDALGNYLYITTESGGECKLYTYDITDKAEPVYVSQIQIGNSCSMIDATGTRAYVASDNNPDEVKIIDIADPNNLQEIGSVKLTGNVLINSVAANGTILHIVRQEQGNQSTYYIYDTSNAAVPVELGSMDLGDGGTDIDLNFSTPPFSFITTRNNSQEFQAINTTDPTDLGVGGSVNIHSAEDASAIAASGTKVYLGSEPRNGSGEFYAVDVTDPTDPDSLGSIEIDAKVNRVRLDRAYAFLATASSTNEFIVINVSDPSSPVIYGGRDLPGTATGMAFSGDTLYITTDVPEAGLFILQAGY